MSTQFQLLSCQLLKKIYALNFIKVTEASMGQKYNINVSMHAVICAICASIVTPDRTMVL